VVGLCKDETRTSMYASEHVGISPAEEGWTVANNNEVYLVAALTCNVLQLSVSVLSHWQTLKDEHTRGARICMSALAHTEANHVNKRYTHVSMKHFNSYIII
jgi:hypothetical protein